jgi:hypothetical protein
MRFPLSHPANIVPDDEVDRRRAEAEFLRKHEFLWQAECRLRNKHFYGAMLRNLPIIGRCWSWLREKGKSGKMIGGQNNY